MDKLNYISEEKLREIFDIASNSYNPVTGICISQSNRRKLNSKLKAEGIVQISKNAKACNGCEIKKGDSYATGG